MQVEILKFLLDARAHLHDTPRQDEGAGQRDDLQAVDRALPDSDWFELAEVRQTFPRETEELWTQSRAQIEF